jgi:hypothetical protein
VRIRDAKKVNTIRAQRGLAGALVIVILILAAIALLVGRSSNKGEPSLDQRARTTASMQRLTEALAGYATLNGRLPCPAAGSSTSGAAEPATATTACTSAAGVIPWASLGLRSEDGLDGWGRRISYRVFSGATGFTQADGVNMTDCNWNAAIKGSADPMYNQLDANGKCKTVPAHATRDTQVAATPFLAAKGLSAQNEIGTVTSGLAYLLISHGESGAGAWLANGGGQFAAPAAGGREYANTLSPPMVFGIGASSAPGTPTTSSTHYDDVVVTMAAFDLVRAARLTGKDWGDPTAAMLGAATTASQSFTRADLTAVLGATPGNNTGQATINFGTFSATAMGSSGRNISSGIGISGEGIGSIGTGSTAAANTTINSTTSEGLNLVFTSNQSQFLGITLVDFGDLGASGIERARFQFYFGGLQVAQIDKLGCSAVNGGAVLANYLLDAGTPFDRVVVTALTTTTASNSTFLVGGLRACDTSISVAICTAPGAVPANDCP